MPVTGQPFQKVFRGTHLFGISLHQQVVIQGTVQIIHSCRMACQMAVWRNDSDQTDVRTFVRFPKPDCRISCKQPELSVHITKEGPVSLIVNGIYVPVKFHADFILTEIVIRCCLPDGAACDGYILVVHS